MNDWTAIFETDQFYRAELIKSILCDNHIEAVILNQKDSSYKFGTIKVMVPQQEVQKAVDLLKSMHCE